MSILNQVGSLLRSEVDCLLWKVLLMVLWLGIHWHVLSWTKNTTDGLLTESSYSWTKVLWVFMKDWVLAESSCVEWLQVVSWTWRNVLLFFFIHHFKISWALSFSAKLLFEADRRALSISSWYCGVIYCSIDCLLWVICSRTDVSLIVSFCKIVYSLRSTVWPFDSTSGRRSNSFTCWVNIISSWA